MYNNLQGEGRHESESSPLKKNKPTKIQIHVEFLPYALPVPHRNKFLKEGLPYFCFLI